MEPVYTIFFAKVFQPPLFFGVSLDKLIIDVTHDLRKGLFLQVSGFSSALLALLLDLSSSLLRSHHTSHFIECVHIESQGVQLTFVVRNMRVVKAVKGTELIEIVPHLGVIRMENMHAILMEIDILHFFRMNISINIVSLVYHKDFIAFFRSLTSTNRSVKS